ncbi:hypothetical protein H9651_13425 [Microbacterium sp. Sa4CUA7]|uniref:Uncharacterized protein n=1 Tax=Microbacterium pullorum TaxID=2762236 RepID=A0ABR8S577_9MICO|nr:hypothetical protein [Microbacterium pullorum]MBD7958641.1 hypothetical protein [Microbacterium pullorum]
MMFHLKQLNWAAIQVELKVIQGLEPEFYGWLVLGATPQLDEGPQALMQVSERLACRTVKVSSWHVTSMWPLEFNLMEAPLGYRHRLTVSHQDPQQSPPPYSKLPGLIDELFSNVLNAVGLAFALIFLAVVAAATNPLVIEMTTPTA